MEERHNMKIQLLNTIYIFDNHNLLAIVKKTMDDIKIIQSNISYLEILQYIN